MSETHRPKMYRAETSDTNSLPAPRVVGPRYWCMACPLSFADADSANAHHDATGHNQTWHIAGTVRETGAGRGAAWDTSVTDAEFLANLATNDDVFSAQASDRLRHIATLLAASPGGGAPTGYSLDDLAEAVEDAAKLADAALTGTPTETTSTGRVARMAAEYLRRLTRSPRAAGEPSDTERLDAIERADVEIQSMGTTRPYQIVTGPGGTFAAGCSEERPVTLRQAIDRAMRPAAPPPERAP